VWESGGQTLIGFRPPTELAGEYDVPDQAVLLERMTGLLGQIVEESLAPG
jgi:hypothetical protein